jgi:chromate transport protein ChrA
MQQEPLKAIGDVLSLGTVVATLAAWLPPVAALFTIIWTLIRIWETQTVKDFFKRWRNE